MTRGFSNDGDHFLWLAKQAKPLFPKGTSLEDRYKALGMVSDGTMFSTGDVTKELDRRIATVLACPEDDAGIDTKALSDHLWLRYFADKLECQEGLGLLNAIRDAIRDKKAPTLESPAWTKALCLARTDFMNTDRPYDYALMTIPRLAALGGAAKGLRKAGYLVHVLRDRIETAAHEPRLLAELDELAASIGGIPLAEFLFKEVAPKFDAGQGRYQLVRGVSTAALHAPKPLVPYGYLLNLATKHASKAFSSPGSIQHYLRLKELATNFAATYDVQPYMIFEGMFNDQTTIVKYLQKLTAFDSLFTFSQSNPAGISKTLLGVFGSLKPTEFSQVLGADLTTVARVADFLLSSPPQGPMIFTARDIVRGATLDNVSATRVLDSLSCDGQPSTGFRDPLRIDLTNWQYPLTRQEREYLMFDGACAAPMFYTAILARLHPSVPDLHERVGRAFERFAVDQMTARGLHVFSGNYTSSIADGECDAVIETDDVVVFIEFKKKPLTVRARGAVAHAILADLARGLLSPHCQTGRHELSLVKDGSLTLRNGTQSHTVVWRGRKIERVAVSLPDFGSLHSRDAIGQILNLLTGRKVSSPQLPAKDLKDINDLCARLGENYALAQKFGIEQPERFFHCWFLPAEALLLLLDNSSSNETFWQELKRTKHLSTGSLNWFHDYAWARRFDPKIAQAVEKTGATAFFGGPP